MFVITYTEEGSPRRAVLPVGETVAGRSPACDIVIDDVSVSRRHAKFTVRADGCALSDLSSRNGTYVNGALVSDADLSDGDRVVLGRAGLECQLHHLREDLGRRPVGDERAGDLGEQPE